MMCQCNTRAVWAKWFIAVMLITPVVQAASEAQVLQFTELALQNDADIPQSYGDIPGRLDVSYRGVNLNGTELEDAFFAGTSAVNFYEKGYGTLRQVIYAAVTGADQFGELTLLPQPGYQVTLHRLRLAGHEGMHADIRIRVLEETHGVQIDRNVQVSGRVPLLFAPNLTSVRGLRFQWAGAAGKVGVDDVVLSITPTHEMPVKPVSNSLGLKFEFVPGINVMFCTTEVRVQDYAAFAASYPDLDNSWKDIHYAGIPQGPDHPVVNVSWQDAQAFCKWLSGKEGRRYRLPTDHEWSCAAGIGHLEPATKAPAEKSGQVIGIYPWGEAYPPPTNAENLHDQHGAIDESIWKYPNRIGNYEDEFPFTAPVGKLAGNVYGLYDLGGNVREFCEDTFADGSLLHVLRGGCWAAAHDAHFRLFTSQRHGLPPGERRLNCGFRLVLEDPKLATMVLIKP